MKPRYLGAAVSQVGLLCLRRVDGQAESQKVSPAFMAILNSCAKLEQDHPSISAFRGVQRVCTRGRFGGLYAQPVSISVISMQFWQLRRRTLS